MTSPTDTPKRDVANLDAFETWFASLTRMERDQRFLASYFMREAWNAALRLSTPPSQGKVERAREIKRRLHDIANGITLRECADSDAHFLHDLADNLPAITQALTESSGQGTDGADAEFMRIAVTDAMTRARQQNWKNGGVHLYDVDELIESLLRDIDRIRSDALPLPVSADGGGAVKWPFGLQKGEWTWRSFTAGENAGKTIVQIKVQRPERDGFQSWLTLDWSDYDGREVYGRGDAEDTAKLICDAMNAYLKFKQPSDTGAGK